MEKDGPLDGRKYNENNKDSQKGQVAIKILYNIKAFPLPRSNESEKCIFTGYQNTNLILIGCKIAGRIT
jgi:hypothetical protein